MTYQCMSHDMMKHLTPHSLTTVSKGRGLHLLRGRLVVPNTRAVGFCKDQFSLHRKGVWFSSHLQTELVENQAHRMMEDTTSDPKG